MNLPTHVVSPLRHRIIAPIAFNCFTDKQTRCLQDARAPDASLFQGDCVPYIATLSTLLLHTFARE